MRKMLLVASILFACKALTAQPEKSDVALSPQQIKVNDAIIAEQNMKRSLPVDVSNFDKTVSPRTDFYQYVNGNWLRNNPVPGSESRWGAFSEVQEFNYSVLYNILESAKQTAVNAPKGAAVQKIGDLYYCGMDSVKLESDGVNPMMPDIERILAINNNVDIVKYVAQMHRTLGAPMFNFFVFSDAKNSENAVPQLGQGGLGMPDRDYYFKEDPAGLNIRNKYREYIINCYKIVFNDAKRGEKMADKIISIELQLAKVSLTREQRRDTEKTYNKLTMDQLMALMPNFDWKIFMDEVKAKNVPYFIIDNPTFFKELNGMLVDVPLEDWKEYLTYNVIRSGAPFLNYALLEQNFIFYSQTLQGTKEMKPRWKSVLQTVDGAIGQLLGQEYCNRVFTPETKARCLTMVNNLARTYDQRIQTLDWMTPETKKAAQYKLSTFMKKIGYPDKYRDYSRLVIDRDSYYQNIKRTSEFDFDYMVSKIGKPVDKTEWMMSPPTVNAYYNPSYNEIVFPAGILQPPFYNADADDAVNYGGIGAVIGHEMTHGFDDEGRHFDAMGNHTGWWQPQDSINFTAKTEMLVNQFNNYTVLDTLHVNGRLTLGENIADLGGITISYYAFMNTLNGKPAPATIDGFTAEQRFFIGWAQVWRNNIRDRALMQRIMIDPHSPGKLRCNGPLSNFEEFYKAFNVQPGDAMYRKPEDRAKIW